MHSLKLRYVGWTAFEFTLEDGRRILADPMLAGLPEFDVPPSPCKLDEFDGVDVVLITHAATDHVGQAFDVMKRSKATLICDTSTRFKALSAGIASDRIFYLTSGVRIELAGLFVKALPAFHHSFSQIGDNSFINSQPLSYLITSPGGVRIFFGGDTSISKEHQLFGELYKPDVAILGVGGVNLHGQSLTELYPDEAALVVKWLCVKLAFPMHYRLDEGAAFSREVKRRAPKAKAVLLKPGECYSLRAAHPSRPRIRSIRGSS